MLNPYMYATPLHVRDVYGHWHYISREHYADPAKTLIPICRKNGLLRAYTPAGGDLQNVICRDNIAEQEMTP